MKTKSLTTTLKKLQGIRWMWSEPGVKRVLDSFRTSIGHPIQRTSSWQRHELKIPGLPVLASSMYIRQRRLAAVVVIVELIEISDPTPAGEDQLVREFTADALLPAVCVLGYPAALGRRNTEIGHSHGQSMLFGARWDVKDASMIVSLESDDPEGPYFVTVVAQAVSKPKRK